MNILTNFIRKTKKVSILCSLALLPISVSQADSPVKWDITYTADYVKNTSGGIKTEDAYLDNLDLSIEVDTEKAFSFKGGTFLIYGLINNNNTFADIVGDAQGTSNIDNQDVVRLYEVWWEQAFGRSSIKLGLIDLNSEFDAIDPAGLFLNSSHGIGVDYAQSGSNGPSIFPTASLGLRHYIELNDRLSIRSAIFDATPGDPNDSRKNAIKIKSTEGALLAFEPNYTNKNTRYAVGLWYYTEPFSNISGTGTSKNSGVYSFIEHGTDIKTWLRIGTAKSDINQFSLYLGGGVTFNNLCSRPDDSIGIAVAHAKNSRSYLNTGAFDSAETNIELTYHIQISENFSLQPDFQYIVNPGTDPSLENAFVAGVRLQINFSN